MMKKIILKIKLLFSLVFVRKKIIVEDIIILSTNKNLTSMILDAFYILNEKSNICFSWIDIVKNNIKFLFINNGHKQNLVFNKYNIVCIYDSYIKKSSSLFFASMLIRWAFIIQENSDYDDVIAKKKQLEFLSCVETNEAYEIIKYLRKYYNI
ncbi:MAG: hypothetical protein E7050_07240 [Lentisphaerae bacterium]|nr:hypothetical protein [Lentisphaerota bacterium]